MKKIVVVLSFIAVGCSAPKATQHYPHYHTTPSIIQGANENTYWESVKKVPPSYPQRALSSGTIGCAKIGFTITSEGSIADPFVIKSIPDGVFDRVSIEAAMKFTYKPSIENIDREPVITSNVFTFTTSAVGMHSYEQLSVKCESP